VFTHTHAHSKRTALSAALIALVGAAALTGCSAGTQPSDGPVARPDASEEVPADAPVEAGSEPEAPEAPGLNTPVTVGSFQFTALGVADAGTTAGSGPLTQTAQGTYVRVDLAVTNVGDKAETFIVNYVKIKDAEGKTYDADGTATIYASGDAQTWIAGINPGNSVQGPILFDVPAGTTPVELLVSDNAFTDGTPITLG